MLGANAFRPWLNGNEQKDIFTGGRLQDTPYIVRASKDSWLPLNVLVFASSEEDAKGRVYDGLKASAKTQYISEHDYDDKNRYQAILELFESGTIQVEPYDPKYICKISWDERGL